MYKNNFHHIFYKIGKYFLLITFLMIFLSALEFIIFTNIKTKCTFESGDVGEFICTKFTFYKLTEFILNIPVYYTILFLGYIPLGTLWLLTYSGPGKGSFNTGNLYLIILFIIWLIAVLSIFYFIYINFKKIIRKLQIKLKS